MPHLFSRSEKIGGIVFIFIDKRKLNNFSRNLCLAEGAFECRSGWDKLYIFGINSMDPNNNNRIQHRIPLSFWVHPCVGLECQPWSLPLHSYRLYRRVHRCCSSSWDRQCYTYDTTSHRSDGSGSASTFAFLSNALDTRSSSCMKWQSPGTVIA